MEPDPLRMILSLVEDLLKHQSTLCHADLRTFQETSRLARRIIDATNLLHEHMRINPTYARFDPMWQERVNDLVQKTSRSCAGCAQKSSLTCNTCERAEHCFTDNWIPA